MYRTRAWRRYKNYTKAKRKRDKDASTSWYGHLWYNNLHQYSKNKIHCSCPLCRSKTRNHGAAAHYAGTYNPTLKDKKRIDSMNNSEVEYKKSNMKYVRFYGDNGYDGCSYEEYLAFSEDEYDEEELNNMSDEYAQENAETYEYVVTGWNNDWDSEDDKEDYYNSIFDYCGWEYITEEEYKENVDGEF